MTAPVVLDAAAVAATLDAAGAVDVLADALRTGAVDPEDDSPRLFSAAGGGRDFLMMPSHGGDIAGVKVLTLSPDNPAEGFPAVQGSYVLFEAEHLAPVAILDAGELTLVRTPATTVLAARHLIAARQAVAPERARADRVVVFGTGPQAIRHIRCLDAVLRPTDIAVAGRRPEAVERVLADTADTPTRLAADPTSDLAAADLIVCVTGSPMPLFPDVVRDDAVVCGVGVHGPDKRELPPELIRRADIVVEGRASALREAGNLLLARPAAWWSGEDPDGVPPANLADLVTGAVRPTPGRPLVFSGVGMAWEDLVVAGEISRRYRGRN
ncbi:ornithine cyclodeaminase family protein [Millisia brevis]|uniref:ornithine cyclodeaminase family protein n=1 Tax=Millisia brevis TaxID=264148 RepID=UPI0008302D91|nr:ornithine cyclodeaminase family protein [Millisia brevis]